MFGRYASMRSPYHPADEAIGIVTQVPTPFVELKFRHIFQLRLCHARLGALEYRVIAFVVLDFEVLDIVVVCLLI